MEKKTLLYATFDLESVLIITIFNFFSQISSLIFPKLVTNEVTILSA